MLKRLILMVLLATLTLASTVVKNADANWGTYQYDPQHTGKVPVVGPSGINIKWSYQHPNEQAFAAGLAEGPDGTIYAAGNDGRAYALNPKTGAVKFYYEGVGVCCAPPVVGADGTIYFSGSGLFALNPDFTLKFYYPDGGSCCGAITATTDNKIYIANGALHAFDANNLTFVDPSNPDPLIAKTVSPSWVFNELQVDWSVAVSADNQTIYATGGGASGNLIAINATTGAKKWALPIVNDLETMPVINESGIIYVADDAEIIAVNPALIADTDTTPPAEAVSTVTTIDGNQVVRLAYDATSPFGATLIATVRPFTIDEGSGAKVFDNDGDTDLYAFSATDGSYLWSQPLLGAGDSFNPIIDATGAIYVATSKQSDGVDYLANLYIFDASGGPIASYTKVTTYDTDVRCPIIGTDGTLYTLIDGALVAFGLSADISVGLYVTPTPAFTNNTVTFITTVSNAGPDRALNTTLKQVMASSLTNLSTATPGCTITSKTVNCVFGELSPSDNVTVVVTGTAPANPGNLTTTDVVKTDSVDPNQYDNSLITGTPVYSPCDLIVTIAGGPATVIRGTTNYSFTATVKNQGTGSCAASTLGFYFSPDTTITNGSPDVLIGNAAVGILASNATQNVTVTTAVPVSAISAGSYYIGAYADSVAGVFETNENNNTKIRATKTTVN